MFRAPFSVLRQQVARRRKVHAPKIVFIVGMTCRILRLCFAPCKSPLTIFPFNLLFIELIIQSIVYKAYLLLNNILSKSKHFVNYIVYILSTYIPNLLTIYLRCLFPGCYSKYMNYM